MDIRININSTKKLIVSNKIYQMGSPPKKSHTKLCNYLGNGLMERKGVTTTVWRLPFNHILEVTDTRCSCKYLSEAVRSRYNLS